MSPCYSGNDGDGTWFIHGKLGPHCADCSAPGDKLCDYPVGNGKTCDRSMCDDHASKIGPNMDYCEAHWRMWEAECQQRGVTALRFPYFTVKDAVKRAWSRGGPINMDDVLREWELGNATCPRGKNDD